MVNKLTFVYEMNMSHGFEYVALLCWLLVGSGFWAERISSTLGEMRN